MKTTRRSTLQLLAGLVLAALGGAAHAFVSGSTGADGALTPAVSTEVILPPSGVLNYTVINIPANVTVTFRRNVTNTPVVLLVQGDATIGGKIDVAGKNGKDVGGAGDGVVADDGNPGEGGPGGYDGGRGGRFGADRNAGAGLGPGGGFGGALGGSNPVGGGGGAHATDGGAAVFANAAVSPTVGFGGKAYGSINVLPLIGGSGGGGGTGGTTLPGTGGGGGGGAILIAASGTVNIQSTGQIVATGGNSGSVPSNVGGGATGGSGAGGAIRIIATSITGNGVLNAVRGNVGSGGATQGGQGSDGRVRLESEINQRTAASTPTHTAGTPGTAFIAGLPTLRIKTVGTETVNASPNGSTDVSLPATVVNPVAVTFETTSVPLGTIVKVTVVPAYGPTATATSNALSGSESLATASASVTLPQGASTLLATLTYNVIASVGDAMSKYAQGERVQQVRLAAGMGARSGTATLVTVSGREFEVPAVLLAGI